jgi:acetylornithine deacetylase
MKGFFAIALEAASRFKAKDLKEPLILIGTADEESSMSGARQLLASSRQLGRKAVIGEPTGLQPIRVHKGVMMEAIRVKGRAGHSSDPSLGANAILGMHQVISALIALQEELKARYRHPAFKVDYPTLNLGAIHGGDNPNRICGHCETLIDIRPLPGMSIETVQALLEERLSGLFSKDSGLGIEILPLFSGVPPFETPAEAELTRYLESATGKSAGAVAFGTEGPFFSALGLETLILGPGSIDQAHQPDEFLSLSDIAPGISLFENLIGRYCRA